MVAMFLSTDSAFSFIEIIRGLSTLRLNSFLCVKKEGDDIVAYFCSHISEINGDLHCEQLKPCLISLSIGRCLLAHMLSNRLVSSGIPDNSLDFYMRRSRKCCGIMRTTLSLGTLLLNKALWTCATMKRSMDTIMIG